MKRRHSGAGLCCFDAIYFSSAILKRPAPVNSKCREAPFSTGPAFIATKGAMPVPSNHKKPGEEDIKRLLQGLNSADPGPAWTDFIDCYSQLILKAVRQFDFEQDRHGECFLFVCEKLSDNQFRRLLGFNTNGKASFFTWLGTVVFNLCVDWHRKEFGRASLLPAIRSLPSFDQAVFRYRYEQALSIDTCFELLRDTFPDLTRRQLSDAIGRVHSILTPRQRWQMSLRIRDRQRVTGASADKLVNEHPAFEAEPDTETLKSQELDALDGGLRQLTAEQRLLLGLRFRQGLTLKEVARLAGLGDPFKARRQIQAALDALARVVQKKNSGISRKN